MQGSSNGTPEFVRSVLHLTDFSTASDRAFAHALAIALLRQARLTILNVSPEHGDEIDWRQFPQVRETLANWHLLEPDSPRSAVFEKLRVKVEKVSLNSTRPVLAAVDYLRDTPFDLVVLATEGRLGSGRWAEASDAETIARWSRTKTLFVPARARRGMISLADGSFDFRQVLVPVDVRPDPAAAIVYAGRAAALLGEGGVDVTLLHAGASMPSLPKPPAVDDVHWAHVCRTGEPVPTILGAASDIGADLIVMPTAGHDSVLDALRGSVTEQVLRKADCPVLAVPAR